jgi:hypothetical protein
LQIGGSPRPRPHARGRERCAENAATASDEQPDSHCKRVFCVAGAGRDGSRGVVVGCGRDVTTLLPQPSLGVLNGHVALQRRERAVLTTQLQTAESKTKRCIYSCLLCVREKNEITACAAIMFWHYFYAHRNVMIFFMSTTAADAAAAAAQQPRRKGAKARHVATTLAFIIAESSLWSVDGEWSALSATAALFTHSLMRRVKWTHPVSARSFDGFFMN